MTRFHVERNDVRAPQNTLKQFWLKKRKKINNSAPIRRYLKRRRLGGRKRGKIQRSGRSRSQ